MSSTAGTASGAFNNPSSGKIDQQRKILEDLERQKKQLAANNKPNNPAQAPVPTAPPVSTAPAEALLTSAQRAALDQAAKSSFGYFIPQDSSFGNAILPVIPRIPNPATASK